MCSVCVAAVPCPMPTYTVLHCAALRAALCHYTVVVYLGIQCFGHILSEALLLTCELRHDAHRDDALSFKATSEVFQSWATRRQP